VSLVAQTPDANKTQAREILDKGIAASKGGDSQLAVDLFVRALELDPDLTNAALYLGVTYASMGTPETNRKAVENFERVLTKEPNNPEALSRLAGLHLVSGDQARARSVYLQLTQNSPQDAVAFYALGALDWQIVMNRTAPLPEAERRFLIEEGLQSMDTALRLKPDYANAMAFKNLLLRQKAAIESDPVERAKLVAEADVLFAQALAARQAAPPPPPPQDTPLRMGSTPATSSLVRSVAPVYPPLARAAGVQGVVLLQTTINKSGQVVGVSVISGHPLLTDAAVEAVQQWTYQPMLLNGQPIDVITTVTVNFSLQ